MKSCNKLDNLSFSDLFYTYSLLPKISVQVTTLIYWFLIEKSCDQGIMCSNAPDTRWIFFLINLGLEMTLNEKTEIKILLLSNNTTDVEWNTIHTLDICGS